MADEFVAGMNPIVFYQLPCKLLNGNQRKNEFVQNRPVINMNLFVSGNQLFQFIKAAFIFAKTRKQKKSFSHPAKIGIF